MATPMTANEWMQRLSAEGVSARYASNWTTVGRDAATGKTFGPVNGVVIHHTAGTSSLGLVRTGTTSLPGPLAHAHLAKDGTLTQVSMHRCNHAGSIAQNAFDAILAEDTLHPRPTVSEPVDGNDRLYGIEIENKGDGRDPYPHVQYDQAVRWAAAVCRHYGWTAHSVVGHKEVTRRKIDPSFSMEAFRIMVAERLAHPAAWNPEDDVKGTPVTQIPGKDTEPVKPQAYRDVAETDAIPAPKNHPDYAENKFWTQESYLRFIAEELIRQRGAGS